MSSFSRASIPKPYNEPMQCYYVDLQQSTKKLCLVVGDVFTKFSSSSRTKVLINYEPGSVQRKLLRDACKRLRTETIEVPCIVNGKEIKTGDIAKQLVCSDHKHVLCTFHQANEGLLKEAVQGALQAKTKWEALPFEDRAAIFLKTADLLNTKYRYEVLAATMLGQGKTVWQAEIDAAAETIDFLRFNPKYAEEIYAQQPPANSVGCWNRVEYRPLEGYVVAISPFNFTAIGANLPSSPALMGNVVLWKPASTAILSNYIVFKAFRDAGLPDGVIQFLPGSGRLIGDTLINDVNFGGLHFTGSTGVFNGIYKKTAENLAAGKYRGYPRIVGETGGKDFHFLHNSADVDHFVFNTLRASFEYQGQKCSACSRAYIPASKWDEIRTKLVDNIKQMKQGQSDDFSVFVSAVIDKNSFNNIKSYIDHAKASPDAEIIVGGNCDDSVGWFVEPTIIQAKVPKYKSMEEEIFGPVLTVYVYPDDQYEETLRLCDQTSPYALTGAIFAKCRYAVDTASHILKNAAGNFYINDKCTGAVVGQQPFGGARASGTNDKAGAYLNLLRWVSARTIKENFLPINTWKYPYLSSEE
ncbi:putative delta-1-pyrroline-5-carboxylate dehydrogenase [Cavenderia fasciculata]|uniref:Multifunctional fusion protein n=1 Tax=Cavenderia fasciculata TaxID=261658 RepID=F4Q011_CACFS|nr:putative delta-1-pyrroline-5-carboxylate dehydrogenase [Cavenderia fasciculata]EGG18925.1 putative delta-1-pyrroline-5-carboxylate dehydrogenase [Cavenderia fasciculata]|eukprot:XP_004357387.1 putative delta-1-pyrroline-5-carboxylate dehydrogenase [Cavenderia fasciculata]